MERFYVTFGQKYRVEPHPYDVRAHPDGWFVVEADDEFEARRIVIDQLGHEWSMLYTADEWASNLQENLTLYHRGELAVIEMLPEPPC